LYITETDNERKMTNFHSNDEKDCVKQLIGPAKRPYG
jgi:hypothetical protein